MASHHSFQAFLVKS